MKPKFRTVDLTFIALFAALMAIGANVTSFIVIGSVPLTLQPFFAVLAGAILGSKRGALSMVVYLLVGLAGAPVFAEFKSGIASFIGPTGGFLIAFIVVSYVTGKIIESTSNPTTVTFMIASFTGLIIAYVIGTTYLYVALNTWIGSDISYGKAWIGMMPFLPKDVIFTIFAALLAPRVYRSVHHSVSISHS